MDAWTGRCIPKHNYLIGGTTRVEGNNKQLYNDMTKLKNELRELARDHQTGKDSQMDNERRLTDIESKIHAIFVQITKVDQDAIVDNQFLMHKLTQLEQTFDESLRWGINNLASNNADAWKNFDEKENEI